MSVKGQVGNSASSKTRLIVADAIPTYREGLKALLSRDKDVEVVGLAGDGEEAIKLATELVPDIVLL